MYRAHHKFRPSDMAAPASRPSTWSVSISTHTYVAKAISHGFS
jgi:hypothetical protein